MDTSNIKTELKRYAHTIGGKYKIDKKGISYIEYKEYSIYFSINLNKWEIKENIFLSGFFDNFKRVKEFLNKG